MSPDDQQIAPVPNDVAVTTLLSDLRSIIKEGQGRAATAINTEIVQTYWKIGERIVQDEQAGGERAAYGEQLLARVGRSLSVEFGRGFAERSLRFMRQFYQTYPIRFALRTELTWTSYRTLMRLPEEQRPFYERGAIAGRWSSRELERQINSMLYERTALSRKPEQTVKRALSELPLLEDEVFKDPYILDFIGLQEPYSERDLEAALIRHIELFLLELGSGFSFTARQQRLTIGDEDFYVDLVFFHRDLRCPVYVDLKMGRLTTADVAQMKLYLNWARRYDKREWENDPIGLILCGSKNNQVIELLLSDPADSVDERIKVAQYLLLDTQEALKKHLAQMSEVWDQAIHEEGSTPADDS